jgi:hypothetical protein
MMKYALSYVIMYQLDKFEYNFSSRRCPTRRAVKEKMENICRKRDPSGAPEGSPKKAIIYPEQCSWISREFLQNGGP